MNPTPLLTALRSRHQPLHHTQPGPEDPPASHRPAKPFGPEQATGPGGECDERAAGPVFILPCPPCDGNFIPVGTSRSD
ncbi:MAG: hypothetical protein WC391_08745 [Methanoregula sp.]